MLNPWGVTHAEARALEMLIQYGVSKTAAYEMEISHTAFCSRLLKAKHRMGKRHTIQALVEWDRFIRPKQ